MSQYYFITHVFSENSSHVLLFEKNFSSHIGSGYCVSYASGRMGFYSLLKALSIGPGDDVLLTGFTCSVMVNAVLRTGANPIYADIEQSSYGTSPSSVLKALTPATKVIVAQHSFGIPCNIQEIVDIARSRNIFTIEDCALTFQSYIGGSTCGTFADAALFSTDHSKPINTITGGLIYTKSYELYTTLLSLQAISPSLSLSRRFFLYLQFLIEYFLCSPNKSRLYSIVCTIQRILGLSEYIFLSQDFGTSLYSSYPYPANSHFLIITRSA